MNVRCSSRSAAYWLAVAAFFLLAAQPARAGAPLKMSGYVESGERTDNALWFTLGWVNLRFVANTANADAIIKALIDANKREIAVTVYVDPDSAAFDAETGRPALVVRTMDYDGKRYVGDTSTPARVLDATASATAVAEFSVMRGLAYYQSNDPNSARPLLDAGLANTAVAGALKVLAFHARATMTHDGALTDFPPGAERDRALAASLADAKSWIALAPDDVDAAMLRALIVDQLGAPELAIAAYQDIATRWPDWKPLAYRRLAGHDREWGKPEKALEWLDKVAAIPGQMEGMAYHYHRGGALDLLGRFDESIAEYTAGLAYQPDYTGAFWRRSCAYAAEGRLQNALEDFHRFQKLQASFQSGPITPARRFDEKREAEVDALLTSAVAATPGRKISGLCEGYWDWGDGKRSRSAFLPSKP